jgi:hypothetical protein
MIHQYVPALKRYQGIVMDAGEHDLENIDGTVRELSRILDDYGIAHSMTIYDGDHVNGVTRRLREHVVPFFARHLCSERIRQQPQQGVGDLDGDGRPEIAARVVYFMDVGSYDLVDVFADRGEGYERVDFLNLYHLGLEDEVEDGKQPLPDLQDFRTEALRSGASLSPPT